MMQQPVNHPVHCDFLDLTYSPDDSPVNQVKVFLLNNDAKVQAGRRSRSDESLFRTAEGRGYGSGVVKITEGSGYHKVSISGGSMAYFRTFGVYDELFPLLAECPHKVTRMDACYDIPEDTPAIIDAFERFYPKGRVALTRKPVKISTILGIRDDGLRSGTVTMGYKSRARITAKFYDKKLQMADQHGQEICPTTRYELTFRDGIASLRDAYSPESIFWHHAGPLLIKPKVPVNNWNSGDGSMGWVFAKPEYDPRRRMEYLVNSSEDIETLIAIADSVGPDGREILLELLREKVLPKTLGDVDGGGVVRDKPKVTADDLRQFPDLTPASDWNLYHQMSRNLKAGSLS